jgi:hypothetical protein
MEKGNTDSSEQQKEAIHTFIQFLIAQQLLPFLDKKIYEKSKDKFLLLKKILTLFDCIQYYFHFLHESTLKLLITNALEYRSNLLNRQEQEKTGTNKGMKGEEFLGNWGLIIESMKIILQQRRDLASNNFQQLISYGREGKPETVDFFLKQLFSNGFIDHLFLSILEDTLKALEVEKNEENYYMLQYFQNTIGGLLHEREEKEKALEEAEKRKELKSTTPVTAEIKKISTNVVTPAMEKLTVTENNNNNVKSTASSSSSTASSWMKEEDLISYSQVLNSLIKECNGDMSLLQDKLLDLLGSSSFSYETFLFVLKENQKACQTANYANKLKLLQFIESFLEKNKQYLGKTRQEIEKEQLATAFQQNDLNSTLSSLSTYHAPQFIDDSLSRNKSEMKKIFTYQTLFTANHLLFNENISNPTITVPSNNKKKKVFRKNMKNKKFHFLKEINQFLYENGFVIIDSFLSLDQVKRVRIESNLFRHFYDQAEIWVGKKAGIGAHLTVPSVRGDRVLWVCGGHNVLGNTSLNEDSEDEEDEKDGEKKGSSTSKGPKQHYAPEGVSRLIKTAGEIEPCKLEVKASAPIRKFTALKECITTYDNFMDELKNFQDDRKAEEKENEKEKEREGLIGTGKESADGEEKAVSSAGGKTGCGEKPLYDNPIHHIYERSDAMLSIYPGDGTRFANHIDNTTQDGRRLSCIAYFNPDWKEEMGGCLRIKPKRHNYSSASSSVAAAAAVNEERKYPNFQDYDAIDIYPYAGRMIIFFSSQIEHEVLPTFGDRHALTIWYYDKYERKEAIERAKTGDNVITKKLQNTTANSTQSIEIQKQAKQFIADLMGGDEVNEDGGNPTEQELQQLTKKVEMLSDDALEIIASITGAPSVSSFRKGFPLLTVTDLKAMRALFRRMGLQS